MLAPVLKAAGYAVTAVGSGEDAISLLKKTPRFDVVITDIDMPDMNGFDLAEAIKADSRIAGVPIIALSSLTSPAAVARGRQAGFRAFVPKFDRQGLVAALKEATVAWEQAA
jgi:two-component system chemotaxis sensor kinase CheA